MPIRTNANVAGMTHLYTSTSTSAGTRTKTVAGNSITSNTHMITQFESSSTFCVAIPISANVCGPFVGGRASGACCCC